MAEVGAKAWVCARALKLLPARVQDPLSHPRSQKDEMRALWDSLDYKATGYVTLAQVLKVTPAGGDGGGDVCVESTVVIHLHCPLVFPARPRVRGAGEPTSATTRVSDAHCVFMHTLHKQTQHTSHAQPPLNVRPSRQVQAHHAQDGQRRQRREGQ